MRKICSAILKMFGWRITGDTNLPSKCVICVAPHTSNWDFILGKLVYKSLGKQASFLMKKSWFFFPLGIILKAIGGIPVNRSKKSSLTETLAKEFSIRDKFQLAITPEGTRKKKDDWKKGFYYIALEGKVPIVVAALDYSTKTVDFKATFHPTGDADKDITEIKSYYKSEMAKKPENFTI